MSIALGFDPDTHNSAWAVADETQVFGCGLIRIPVKFSAQEAEHLMIKAMREGTPHLFNTMACFPPQDIVCEGQHHQKVSTSQGRRKIPANGLFRLGRISGAFAMLASTMAPEAVLHFPPPASDGKRAEKPWKYAVKKDVHNSRILLRYNLTPEHIADLAGCAMSHTNHVIDAIGLARWAAMGKVQQ